MKQISKTWEEELGKKYHHVFEAWRKQGYVLDLESSLTTFISQLLDNQREELEKEFKEKYGK